MKRLNTDRINDHAPYNVSYDEDGALVFSTDYGVDYSVTFDDEFVVHDIKIVEGDKGYFVAMPNKKVGEVYKDVAHPLKAETRKRISDAIFAKYEEVAGAIPVKEPEEQPEF